MLTFQLPTAPSENITVSLDAAGVDDLMTILSTLQRRNVADHFHLMLGNELTNDDSMEPDLAKMVTIRYNP